MVYEDRTTVAVGELYQNLEKTEQATQADRAPLPVPPFRKGVVRSTGGLFKCIHKQNTNNQIVIARDIIISGV